MFAGCWPTEGALSAATGHQTNLSLPRNQVLGFRGLAIFLFGPSSNTVRAQNPNTNTHRASEITPSCPPLFLYIITKLSDFVFWPSLPEIGENEHKIMEL